MSTPLSQKIWPVLVCPACGGPLEVRNNSGAECVHCSAHYPYTSTGSLDLRLQSVKTTRLEFELGNSPTIDPRTSFLPLQENPHPQVDYSNIDVPYHLSKELMSYLPKARNNGSLMLDLGCGGTIHRGVCEYAGFEYVGLDYDAPKAPILGDAHSLPFKDESFEFILSIAVLEHIQYPFLMAREAFRVLKPGGTFLGTVAFLEPFHLDSYYHHSHLGTYNSLCYGGFDVQKIAPHQDWSVLKAQAVMGLFQRFPRRLSELLVYPLDLFSKMWWKARYIKNRGRTVDLNDRVRNTTGAFSFIAMKTLK